MPGMTFMWHAPGLSVGWHLSGANTCTLHTRAFVTCGGGDIAYTHFPRIQATHFMCPCAKCVLPPKMVRQAPMYIYYFCCVLHILCLLNCFVEVWYKNTIPHRPNRSQAEARSRSSHQDARCVAFIKSRSNATSSSSWLSSCCWLGFWVWVVCNVRRMHTQSSTPCYGWLKISMLARELARDYTI